MEKSAAISLAVLLAVGVPCFAGKGHAPLSPKILAAKTVYIENHGSVKLADRAYDEIQKWGRWKAVQDRTKADLILLLSAQEEQSSSGRTATYDPSANNGYGGWKYGRVRSETPGFIHAEVLDAKTGEILYADTRRPGFKSATRGILKELQKRIQEQERASKQK